MCGIAGIFHTDGQPVPTVLLKRMTDALAHRGPDGEGFFNAGFVALGHRRLAIIDLSPGGHQPMSTPDGALTVTYNGEIYNYQELRVELESHGHRFTSRSDTEVLLHAWAEWGRGALQRLNGMFAFAVWDRRRAELTLARDRYGIKPLYYHWDGRRLSFGSEVKALLTLPDVAAELDREALVEYLTFQNFFTDRTLFAGIRMLPAAHSMTVTLASAALATPERYWDFNFADPDEAMDDRKYIDTVQQLFTQAVHRQLIGDVPVGSYLSGGLDTGSITAVASGALDNLRTFTIGFDLTTASGLELAFDERQLAEYMSYVFKTEHYQMVLKAGDMERVLPRLIWHLEEPRIGQSYPNFYAAQLASRFNKVVLAGTGGDEIFGGYPWRYYRAASPCGFEEYVDTYYRFWQRLVPAEQLPDTLSPIWNQVRHIDPRDVFRAVFDDHQPELQRSEDCVKHSLYLEAKTFLHGLLVVEDKLSMAHSLETRVPFLDNDLVDFAMRIPVRLKLGEPESVVRLNENESVLKKKFHQERTRDGKLVLRQAMRKLLPERITGAVKQGFSGPDGSWFKGDSIDYVRRVLFHRRARIYDYIDRTTVQTLVREHLEGRQNRRLLIWSLLCLEEWCRLFLDGGAPPENGLPERRHEGVASAALVV
ncbi:MAG: asparagine synthase (glutamine-hydrolyzing) [Gammaproteobacteria bacterium]